MATTKELTDAYHAVSNRLIDSAGSLAVTAFQNLGSWRDPDAAKYIALMTRSLDGIKTQASNLELAYAREIAKVQNQTYTAPSIPKSELTTAALRNGVDAEIVYRRPFVEVYTALDQGKTMTEAIDAGVFRARSLATTEIQLARRKASLISRNGNKNVVGYLRTLTGRENCALCYVASTQRYHKADLLPIHPGCDCGTMDIYGNSDPGQVINETLLEAVHEVIEDRFGQSNRSAVDYNLIAVRDHGELGPVLTIRDQHFTGPDDL